MSSESQRAQIQSKIWSIANDVRGPIDGWDLNLYQIQIG